MELPAAVAFLLLPTVLLVATVPTWLERRHAAIVVAREVARVAVVAPEEAPAIAERVAGAYGVAAGDVRVEVEPAGGRGGLAVVRVTVVMPALVIPGVGDVAGFSWTATQVRRFEDYRSR